MVVQAGAERRLLDHGKGDAREVLGSIETVGRSALTEMRRMVTILRQDRAEGLLPQPTLADVPTLVEQMRSAGLSVTLHQSGQPAEIPIGLQLSAYRIVQEALTNALKHAGGAPVEVQIRYAPNELGLEIRDRGRGHADSGEEPGHGLAGMRERVAMYGGLIETGLQQDGGFAVRVLLPVR
jgi:signal transduction histidine kinase